MFERVGPRALKLVKHTNTRKKEKKKQSLYLLLVLVLEMILINYLFKNLYIFTIGTKNLVHVPYATVYMKLCSMHSSLENVCMCISACPAFLGPHIFCVPARSFLLLLVVGKLDGPVLKKLADCSYDPVSLHLHTSCTSHLVPPSSMHISLCTPYT